jgi:hypothetical protein
MSEDTGHSTHKCASIAAILSALSLVGCSGTGSPASAPADPPPVSNTIPRLEAGPHLGYIVGFDALDSQKTALADSLLSQATASGQNFTRVQLGWDELEPQSDVFDIAGLMDALDIASANQQTIFLSLTTLDTGSLTLPADLVSADGSTTAAGIELDGPEIRARFHSLLDWLVPELAKYNVWGLAIANESSTNFSSVDQAVATAFLSEGADYAQSLDANLAITVTLVGAFFDPDVERFAVDLMPHLDFAMFNFYCLDGQTLLATSSTDWATEIEKQVSVAAGRPIVYQELGCPAGFADLGGTSPTAPTIGASAQLQDDFFRFMIDQIITREALRGAFVFQLFDWSPALTQSFTAGLLDPNDPTTATTAERLTEWLMTVGMCRWSDNTCRPAWTSYLDGVVQAANARTGTGQ